jgi:hypothetical protein
MGMTIQDLDEFPSFDLSFELFGAHWGGNRTERDACIAESHDSQILIWDRTCDDLAIVRQIRHEGPARVPDWWALTWVPGALTSPHRAVA